MDCCHGFDLLKGTNNKAHVGSKRFNQNKTGCSCISCILDAFVRMQKNIQFGSCFDKFLDMVVSVIPNYNFSVSQIILEKQDRNVMELCFLSFFNTTKKKLVEIEKLDLFRCNTTHIPDMNGLEKIPSPKMSINKVLNIALEFVYDFSSICC